MARKKAEFPSTVYVGWEYDGDTKFLVSQEDIQRHADFDGDTRVGIYKLVEVVTVKVKIETQPD
ncbi:MAG: hypothetical protein KGH96_23475 [Sphingomonadales bacterium]|nr:hypothetical protein [Sphingomonadales bacterium]